MFSAIFNKYTTSTLGMIATTVPLVYFIRKHLNTEDDEDMPIHEVLFFSEEGIVCRDHFIKDSEKKACSLKNCSFYNLSRMLHFLNSADTTLDVCMYLLTVKDLGAAVLRAQKRGVKVRVIADEDMANGSGSQILSFHENGLLVKCRQKSTTLMHHKFVVIDNRIVMTGSLNWTMQAICGNWDNLIITSEYMIVRQFSAEFERLWNRL
uniref:Mitochondrial cardiolipin hydrolase n=1 Tax=Graphocephala atropunctata TaxID=36148 RepID=A0A1B6KCR5_9HEMI